MLKRMLRRRPPAARRLPQRGVAMLLVIIAIAILTALGAEFTYNSRVDLQLAANYRDEIRAYYLARSGVEMSRLVLMFQKQLDNINIPGLGGGMKLSLFSMAKIDCHMLKALMPQSEGLEETSSLGETSLSEDDDEKSDGASGDGAQQRSFGGFEGCFQTEIESEDTKINLNRIEATGNLTSATVVGSMLALLKDQRFEFLFEKADSNGVKVTPTELLENIRDWVDENQTRSGLTPAGLFVDAYSDEGSVYSRYEPRYRPKNFRFDTLDEIYMVHGVNDAVMAAFRDRFTVYTSINEGININTDDPLLLYLAVLTVANPPTQPALQNPLFVSKLIQSIKNRKIIPFMGMSVKDFLTVVQTEGVAINTQLLSNANGILSEKRTAYTIRATGEAGSVQKNITAVVNMAGASKLGQLVYWREE